MKTTTLILMVCISVMTYGQTKTEKITKELSFEKKGSHNALLIVNVEGSITVEGYPGDVILVEVEKTITGKTPERLEKGMKEIGLGVLDRADTLILFVDGVCPSFGKNQKNNGGHNRWGYDWNDCSDRNREYDYKLNFRVKIPSSTNIDVSTINNGNIAVEKVSGQVRANNINGGIRLAQLMKAANAHTINGNVDVEYAKNPDAACRFYTLNGDINAYFRKELSSNVSFKTYNGGFYTNLEKITAMPVRVEKNLSEKGFKYKINGNQFKAGNGGVQLDFETFNGNVYLREN